METEIKLLLAGEKEALALRRVLGAPLAQEEQENVYFDTAANALGAARWSIRLRKLNTRVVLTLKSPGRKEGDFVSRGEWEADLPVTLWPGLRSGQDRIAAQVAALLDQHHLSLPKGVDVLDLVPFGWTRTWRTRFHLPAVTVQGGPPSASQSSAKSDTCGRASASPLSPTLRTGGAGSFASTPTYESRHGHPPERLLPEHTPTLVVELDRTLYPDGSEFHELELEIPDAAMAAATAAQLKRLMAAAGVPWQPSAVSKLARLRDLLRHPGRGA